MQHNHSLSSLLKARRRRDARSELVRDLASFETRNDLTDLADRHADADAAAVRDLVDWSRAA